VVQARVADHHPVNPARSARTLEVGFRAAEAPGVLINVEQQHHAAAEPARRVPQPGSDVGEDRGPALESDDPRPCSHPPAISPDAGG